jgi:3-phosphoshikimate 1-carboxyvinyltransferase
MDITIHPSKLYGSVTAIPSKSQAHRLLICAAFADRSTELILPDTNRDIEATADCLNALGAKINRTSTGYTVEPIHSLPAAATLPCCESGSTLRFLLPIVGALGVDGTFVMEGRLPNRPLSPLLEEMERMGCRLSRPTSNTLRCTGKLRSGVYTISGSVSSQFITGLLFAASLLSENSRVKIIGPLESKPYVDMTLQAMSMFGVQVKDYIIPGKQVFRSPGAITVEGDWSNAAFFLAAAALGSHVDTLGLNFDSSQGDKAALHLISSLSQNITVSAKDIPDLVPILSVVAACNQGAVFTDIARLRLKESDRVASVITMLEALGGKATATEHTLTVYPASLTGGTVDSANDHRIAMSAAIAATTASADVTILGAECVSKSYPKFWEEYRRLGGNYEQHIR